MKINELLPCPFCGGNSLINSTNLVQCRACDASGPDLGHAAGEEDRAEAARMWNRRAPISGEPVTEEIKNVLKMARPYVNTNDRDEARTGEFEINLLCKIDALLDAPISGERERSLAPQMPPMATRGSGIAEVDSPNDRLESATSVQIPSCYVCGAGVSGERVRGVQLVCLECGAIDKLKGITYERAGEPNDYDTQCTECGGLRFAESLEEAMSILIEKSDRSAQPDPGERVREALQMLHDDTKSYIEVNNLGDPWHNQSMKLARDALALPVISETQAALRERCAKVCDPVGNRPCDCGRCYCGNSGNLADVERWDEATALAKAIRALPLAAQPEGK